MVLCAMAASFSQACRDSAVYLSNSVAVLILKMSKMVGKNMDTLTDWTTSLAQTIYKICQSLRGDLMRGCMTD